MPPTLDSNLLHNVFRTINIQLFYFYLLSLQRLLTNLTFLILLDIHHGLHSQPPRVCSPPRHLQAPGNHTTMQHRHEANLADPRFQGLSHDMTMIWAKSSLILPSYGVAANVTTQCCRWYIYIVPRIDFTLKIIFNVVQQLFVKKGSGTQRHKRNP